MAISLHSDLTVLCVSLVKMVNSPNSTFFGFCGLEEVLPYQCVILWHMYTLKAIHLEISKS